MPALAFSVQTEKTSWQNRGLWYYESPFEALSQG